jgi:hypothetical protein
VIPVVEVRGALASSPETSGPGAGTIPAEASQHRSQGFRGSSLRSSHLNQREGLT